MAFFTKKTWVARQGTGLNKFSINGATPVTVVNQPDSVTEQGDALSATNLNNLEQRIYNAFLDVDGVFDNIEDGIVLVGRAKADQNGDIIDETYAKQNGYYAELGAGTAEQLVSTQTVDDDDAYLFRTSGGSADIGNRETDEIIGGTLGVNQEVPLASGLYKNGYTATDNADNGYTLTASSLSSTSRIEIQPSLVANHVYFVNFDITMPVSASITMIAGRAWESVGTTVANTKFSHNSVFKKDPSYASYVNFAIMMPNNEMSIGDTVQLKNFNLIDLTAMFGSEIADYILALETATAGAGVAWFRRYFPKPYYPYNAGGLSSVKPSSHDMTGFNQWDEEWESGSINATTGANEPNASLIRSKNYIRVVEGQNYFALNRAVVWFAYDANKNFIGYAPTTDVPNLGYYIDTTGISYLRFRTVSSYGTVYKNDICLNVKWSGTRDGEYEPFELHSYPLDDSTEYRGVPKLDAEGNLYFEGDIYKSSGDVTRRFGVMVLNGTEAWGLAGSGTGLRAFIDKPSYVKFPSQGVCDRFVQGDTQEEQGTFDIKEVYIRFNIYGIATDEASFKTWLSTHPTTLVYEKTTPTTEQVDPFTNPQIVNDWGTEQYVDTRDMPIPVGHNTQYMANLRDKLQHLPNLANADGEYVVKQTGTQMELVKTDNLKKDGYYPTLAVGTADNLRGKGTVGANFTFRTSGGSADIGSGSARIDRINGNTLMFRQMILNGNFPTGTSNVTVDSSLSLSIANNKATITVMTESTLTASRMMFNLGYDYAVDGHKYLVFVTMKAPHATTPSLFFGNKGVYGFTGATANQKTVCVNLFTCQKVSSTSSFVVYVDAGGGHFSQGEVIEVENVMCFDLTQMFGSGNEPTVDEFKALFPLDYYDYTEGTPLNFKGTGLKTDGFNQWDEQWEVGALNTTTGENTPNSNVIRSKNFTKVFPLTTYYCKAGSLPSSDVAMFFYDANKNFLYLVGAGNTTFRTPSNAHYVRFFCSTAYGNTYKNDICINLSWSGIRNGEYEPHWDSTLDLPIATVKGKASGSDESVVIFPDGMMSARNAHDELTAKKGIVRVASYTFTGSEGWEYSSNTGHLYFRLDISSWGAKREATSTSEANMTLEGYTTASSRDVYNNSVPVSTCIPYDNDIIMVYDSSYTDASTFASHMAGKTIFFELANPVEYTLDEELNLNYRVDDFGTEQLLPENTSTPTTSPLVAEIAYAMNAVDTLRNLDKNFTNLATLDALIAIINSKCGVTITRGSFDSVNNRYTFS